MDAAEYLESVTGQIRCRKAREMVARELKNHIDDQTQDYMNQGISEEEALREAVRQMGDAVEVGMEMDRIHRPRLDRKMLILIAVFAVAGGMIQYFIWTLTEESGALPSIAITILTIVSGVALMSVLQLADYTVIGNHPVAIWVILLLIPIVCYLTRDAALPITGTLAPIPLLSMTLPGYCGIVFHYRHKGVKGLVLDILWLLPLILVYQIIWLSGYPTNLTQLQILLIIFSCLVILMLAVVRGWHRINRLTGLLVLWGSLGLVLAFILIKCLKESFYIERLRAFLNPDSYANSAGYQTITMRKVLEGTRLFGSGDAVSPLPPDTGQTFYLILTRLGLAAGILLALLFLALLLIMVTGVGKQKNVMGGMVGTACILGIFMPVAVHILTNLTLLPLTDIYLPFCYPSFSMNMVCYTLAGLYLSVYRYTDIVA